MAYLGWPSLCIRVSDLETSKRFYSTLGFDLISEVPDLRVIMGFGSFRLALMTFLDENLLNVRGGDVVEAHRTLISEFPDLEGEPGAYSQQEVDADADGCSWSTRDPDGNSVFFDTNELEVGPEALRQRALDILNGAAAELELIGAEPDLVARLRENVIAAYAGAI